MDPKVEELRKKIADLEKEIGQQNSGDKKKKEIKEKKSFEPLKILYKWSAPSRVFIQRDKTWFLKIAAVALILILLFAFLQDFMIILVICVIVLISFLLGSIPPTDVEHKITNKGVDSIDRLYKWDELKDFWVAEKMGYKIIYISTKARFPSRLVMLTGSKDEEQIVRLLGEKLEYREYEPKQGWLSKMSDGETVDPAGYAHLFKGKARTKIMKIKEERELGKRSLDKTKAAK
jgi:hypothetical protein